MSSFTIAATPWAKQAGQTLSMPWQAILAQWVHETADGTSSVFKNTNNAGGIKYNKYSIAIGSYGAYAKYSGWSQFTQDYIRVMKLSYYDKVRAAGSIQDTIYELGKSAYAGSHYAEIDYDKDGVHEAGESLLYRLNQLGVDAGTITPNQLNINMPDLSNMSQADLKGFAVVGAAVLAVVALLPRK